MSEDRDKNAMPEEVARRFRMAVEGVQSADVLRLVGAMTAAFAVSRLVGALRQAADEKGEDAGPMVPLMIAEAVLEPFVGALVDEVSPEDMALALATSAMQTLERACSRAARRGDAAAVLRLCENVERVMSIYAEGVGSMRQHYARLARGEVQA